MRGRLANRALLVGLPALALALACGRAAVTSPRVASPAVRVAGAAPAPSYGEPLPAALDSYCGIQSLWRALQGLGKNIPFARLVKADYLSSRHGSSTDDLTKAATDVGAFAALFSRGTRFMLRYLDHPAILHVKPIQAAPAYNHWVLFTGLEGERARIYDGSAQLALVDLPDLASRWDGNGIIVSDCPVSGWSVFVLQAAPALFVCGVAALGVALLRTAVEGRWSEVAALQRPPGQLAAVGALVVAVTLGARACRGEFLLDNQDAVRQTQNVHWAHFVERIGVNGLRGLLATARATVVDVRPPGEFALGSFATAINLPAGSSPSDCRRIMVAVPKTNRIILASTGYRCPNCAWVGQLLKECGYPDVVFLDLDVTKVRMGRTQ